MPEATVNYSRSVGAYQPIASEADEVTSSKIKMLLVDDHVLLRQGLSSMLSDSSEVKVVGQCGDTRSGIYMIERLKPDIAFVDLNMSGVSPFELVRRARVLHPSCKVIFLAQNSTDSNLEQGLDSGAWGFISKTETIEGIIKAIQYVFMGEKYFSSEIKKRILSRETQQSDVGTNTYVSRRNLLSPRELEVLCCVARGMKAKSIGKTLHITAKTVERHKSNIMAKLGLHSQVDLALYAVREGYVQI
jgi:DNA-binding NarL/FixJ family response regulator